MAVVFAVLTLVHFMLAIRFHKGGRFMWIAVVSALFETLGYCCRYSVINVPGAWSYLFFIIFTVVTPVLIALINYIVVGKLLRISEHKIPICCCWCCCSCCTLGASGLKCIFLFIDIVCAVCQTGGGVVMVVAFAMGNTTLSNIGSVCLLAGLVIQLVFFVAFAYVVSLIILEKKYMGPLHAKLGHPRVKSIFIGLTFTMVLLFIRNVYRIAEYTSGTDGYAVTHEWVFFTFESAPIALSFIGYAIWHFGYLLGDDDLLNNAVKFEVEMPAVPSSSSSQPQGQAPPGYFDTSL